MRLWARVLLLVVTYFLFAKSVYAIECGDAIPSNPEELQSYIGNCSGKISAAQGQQKTLSSTIKYLNNQISLTEAQIISTEKELDAITEEIKSLTLQIGALNTSLSDLTRLFALRLKATYKNTAKTIFGNILTSVGVSDLLERVEYLNKVRDNDQRMLVELEETRLDYDSQKNLKTKKQDEFVTLQSKLTKQKSSLSQQQADKNKLLLETKNDEAKYQSLLSTAKAELEAIQGIIAGRGTETKVGQVGEGQKIASLIIGASPCSTNTHLHLEIVENNARRNPFDLLRPTSLIWDNSDAEQNGRGSWAWPLADPIRVTQGYGQTSYSSRYAGNFHTGVDLVNISDSSVKATKGGELYQGGMACGKGTLRYVHVKSEGNVDIYYLHVNYF